MLKKNAEFTGVVEGVGSNGEGIVRGGDTTFFVPYVLPGETVRVKILKVKNQIGYAKALEICTPSDERVRPGCKNFTRCGGCQLQHARYEEQLRIKRKTVKDALRKIAGIDADVLPVIGSDKMFAYRNKLQIPVGVGADGRTTIGFFAERSHRVVPVDACPIHPDWAQNLIAVFHTYMDRFHLRGYDEVRREGDIRNIVVREVAESLLITVVSTRRKLPGTDDLVKMLAEHISSFSLYLNVNAAHTNVVFGEEFVLLYGSARYIAREGEIRYEVGPNTFVQINPNVCRKLYDCAVTTAANSGCTAAIDCYSGGGLMTAMLARALGKAYGIEIVREAVECADQLKELNNLEDKMINRCGKVEDILPEILQVVDAEKTFLVVDPPRKGIDRATLYAILKSGISQMVMISCDPATMARDVGILTGALIEHNQELKKTSADSRPSDSCFTLCTVQPFDMFPQTRHIETLVVLSKKIPDSHINIDVEFGESEGQFSLKKIKERAESRKPKEKVTYKKMQDYIEQTYGFKVHTAYIAEVKRDLGLPMYDAPNAVEELKHPRPHPTPKMVEAIKETLKHFEII